MVLNKNWSIAFTEKADRELGKLDKPVQIQIKNFLESIIKTPNPRVKGSQLKGTLRQFWRYRVGNYRLICTFKDEVLIIHVLKVAHRREVYKTSI